MPAMAPGIAIGTSAGAVADAVIRIGARRSFAPRSTSPGPKGSLSKRSRCWKWLIITGCARRCRIRSGNRPASERQHAVAAWELVDDGGEVATSGVEQVAASRNSLSSRAETIQPAAAARTTMARQGDAPRSRLTGSRPKRELLTMLTTRNLRPNFRATCAVASTEFGLRVAYRSEPVNSLTTAHAVDAIGAVAAESRLWRQRPENCDSQSPEQS